MKEIMDSIPSGEPAGKESFANRKLIRPTFPRVENHGNHGPALAAERPRAERHDHSDGHHLDGIRGDGHRSGGRPDHARVDHARVDHSAQGGGKKPAPPEQTNAENFYYQKQMQSRTSMVIVLRDGEEIHGVIEWYDRNCLKVTREGGQANLMIYKPAIKYMYKEGEGS